MNVDDYIIATKTIRGHCELDRRYKIFSIYKKGDEILTFDFIGYNIIYEEDYYLIMHNSRYTLSNCSYFKYDYKYNRIKKLKKINKITKK